MTFEEEAEELLSSSSSTSSSSSISVLTDWQEILLAMLPVCSAVLSILGSGTIIRLTMKRKLETPYDRLLFGLSTADLLSSTTNGLAPFLGPSQTSPRIWSIGTNTTCSILGFFWQFTTAGFMYSGILSLYYYLTVRHGMTKEYIATTIEPYMHGAAIIGPFLSAIIGLLVEPGYQEVRLGPGCWTRSSWFGYVFTAVPIFVIVPSIIYFQISIYQHVKTTLERSGARSRMWDVALRRNYHQNNNNNNTTTNTTLSPQARKLRLVATQNFLYVGVFFLVNLWPTIIRMLDDAGFHRDSETTLYFLLLLQAIFLPIQGFFNVCIFVRPRYLERRKRFPTSESWIQSIVFILHHDNTRSSTAGMLPTNSATSDNGGAATALWTSTLRLSTHVRRRASEFTRSISFNFVSRDTLSGVSDDKSSGVGVSGVSGQDPFHNTEEGFAETLEEQDDEEDDDDDDEGCVDMEEVDHPSSTMPPTTTAEVAAATSVLVVVVDPSTTSTTTRVSAEESSSQHIHAS